MGSSLGSVLAITIISELENKIIKLYCCYVDNALLVRKLQHVSRVHNLVNRFDNNFCYQQHLFYRTPTSGCLRTFTVLNLLNICLQKTTTLLLFVIILSSLEFFSNL